MKWLISAILVGLLGLFFFTNSLKINKNEPIQSVGRILSTEGQVMGLSTKDQSFVNLKAKDGLFSPHEIKTGMESHCVIEFGEVFKLLPNSNLRLIKSNNEYQVHILKGRIERSSTSLNTSFFINENKVDGLHLGSHSPKPMAALSGPQNQPTSIHLQTPKSKFQKSLEETIKLHQRFLEKCFIKHYERTEGNTKAGVVITHFVITKKGDLSQVEIIQSQYKDSEFHQCIQDVVSRVRIPQYSGKVTPVEFPFNFTLPE